MKYFTPALINNTKKGNLFKRIFMGQKAQEAYYTAEHKEQKIKLLWMEASRFGKLNCYPCALEEEDGVLVFRMVDQKADAEENAALVRRWGLFVDPDTFHDDYIVEELSSAEFNRIFFDYRVEDARLLASDDERSDEEDEGDEPPLLPSDSGEEEDAEEEAAELPASEGEEAADTDG